MESSLCVIGDSITAGVVMAEDTGRYYHCPDSFINLLGGALDAEIRNHSKFGCRVTNALTRLGRMEKDVAECGHTIIMLGGNDSDFDWPAVAEKPEEWHDCFTPMAEFLARYNELIDRILALGGSPVVMNLMPVDGRKYYRWISTRADGEALMRFLGGTESIEHWNEMYSIAVMKIAYERGLPLLDLRSVLLRERKLETLTSPDGIHPSVAGHKVMFEGLLPEVRKLLS